MQRYPNITHIYIINTNTLLTNKNVNFEIYRIKSKNNFVLNNLSTWGWWSADWFNPAITGVVTEEWNELVFRYTGTGDASWNHQIGIEGIEFEYGATYKLTFDAKSDLAFLGFSSKLIILLLSSISNIPY